MRFGLFAPVPPVRNLMIALAIFPILGAIYEPLLQWTLLDTSQVMHGQLWRLFTYIWAEPLSQQWIFNLLALWCFGNPLYETLGGNRLYKLFLGAGIMGAVGVILGGLLFPASRWMLPFWAGPDLAVFGLLWAFSMSFPDSTVYVMMVIPCKGKYLGPICALFLWLGARCSLLGVVLSVLVSHLMVTRGWWLEFKSRFRKKGAPKSRLQFMPAPSIQKVTPIRPEPSAQTNAEREVDRILDKLRDLGITSLSADERATLDSHSRQLRQRDGI